MITRLQSVLPERVAPTPVDDTAIVLVVYGALGSTTYWCADGAAVYWCSDRSKAKEFRTYRAASDERQVAKRMYPTMRITMRGNWMVTS